MELAVENLTENEEEIKRKMGKRESDIVLSNQ
jgi:hypothetical protein